MGRSINKVILIGNVGKDPEMRYTGAGKAVASFSLATSESWKSPDGEQQEKTQWHRMVAFGKLAEIVGEYVKKGSQLYTEGKINYGNYEKGGVKHYTTDIVIDQMVMLGGKRDGATHTGGEAPPAEPGGRVDDLPF